MGNRPSQSVSTDSYVRQVRQVSSGMSDRDRRLYNFARIKIAEENLDDVEVTIGFQDQDPYIIQEVADPSGQVYIGFNEYDVPTLEWTRRGFWRSVKRFFLNFSTLKSVLVNGLSLGANIALKRIGWY